jgi:hypothetical protein
MVSCVDLRQIEHRRCWRSVSLIQINRSRRHAWALEKKRFAR